MDLKLRKDAYICPQIPVATHLTCPASAVIMGTSQCNENYFIVGKVNGDVIFFGEFRQLAYYYSPVESPITAIACGKLTQSFDEVISISADGLLQSIHFPFPNGPPSSPYLLFDQLLNANICAARIDDIDGDGINELLVVMTDRVVRSYRYVDTRLQSLNKWELPAQIRGLSLGRTSNGRFYALLAQAMQNYAVRIDFVENNCITIPQIVADERNCSIDVPFNPVCVNLINSLCRKLLVVDEDCKNDYELKNIGGLIVATSVVILKSGIRLIVTSDTRGNLLIYGWTDDKMSNKPVGHCRILFEVDHMAAIESVEQNAFLVGVSTLHSTVAIYRITLTSLFQTNLDIPRP